MEETKIVKKKKVEEIPMSFQTKILLLEKIL